MVLAKLRLMVSIWYRNHRLKLIPSLYMLLLYVNYVQRRKKERKKLKQKIKKIWKIFMEYITWFVKTKKKKKKETRKWNTCRRDFWPAHAVRSDSSTFVPNNRMKTRKKNFFFSLLTCFVLGRVCSSLRYNPHSGGGQERFWYILLEVWDVQEVWHERCRISGEAIASDWLDGKEITRKWLDGKGKH